MKKFALLLVALCLVAGMSGKALAADTYVTLTVFDWNGLQPYDLQAIAVFYDINNNIVNSMILHHNLLLDFYDKTYYNVSASVVRMEIQWDEDGRNWGHGSPFQHNIGIPPPPVISDQDQCW